MFAENICIIQSLTGKVIGKIILANELVSISCPWSIGCNYLGNLVVSGMNASHHIIETLEMFFNSKTNQIEWKSSKIIEESEKGLRYPFGLVVDSVSSNIIACDSLNHRVVIFKHDGTIVKSFGTRGVNSTNEFSTPMGLCINKLTGQLLVADSESHRVVIFK